MKENVYKILIILMKLNVFQKIMFLLKKSKKKEFKVIFIILLSYIICLVI